MLKKSRKYIKAILEPIKYSKKNYSLFFLFKIEK